MSSGAGDDSVRAAYDWLRVRDVSLQDIPILLSARPMSSDNALDFLCAGPAVLGLFVGLCGLTVLFLFNLQLLY